MIVTASDNTKFFLNPSQPEKLKNHAESHTPADSDKKMSNSAKYMIGATALAATIAICVVGHKNNWWKNVQKAVSNEPQNVNPKPAVPSSSPQNDLVHPERRCSAPEVGSGQKPEQRNQGRKKSPLSRVKKFFTSPFDKINAKKAAKKEAEELERKRCQQELLRIAIQEDANQRIRNEKLRQQIIADEPARLRRIAAASEQCADLIREFSAMDFGKIDTQHILPQSRPCVMDYTTAMRKRPHNPELFAPAPKKGEYSLKHLAVSGYWNNPKYGCGARSRTFNLGLELDYQEQFTLHQFGSYKQMDYENMTNGEFYGIHWGMQKAAVLDDYRYPQKIHLGTALRFSAPECAWNKFRPLGFNIFIEGEHSLQEMEKIRKHLVDSGTWAKHLAIQDDDTIIEVFNEIIKCLNK